MQDELKSEEVPTREVSVNSLADYRTDQDTAFLLNFLELRANEKIGPWPDGDG